MEGNVTDDPVEILIPDNFKLDKNKRLKVHTIS